MRAILTSVGEVVSIVGAAVGVGLELGFGWGLVTASAGIFAVSFVLGGDE